MLRDLPEFVQEQILEYLKNDNFTGAKTLYDAWTRHQTLKRAFDIENLKTPTSASSSSVDLIPKQKVIRIEEMLSVD